MNKVISKLLLGLMASATLLSSSGASAAMLTEDFEAPFPTWESGWLGTNSNLRNYYGVGQGRGNNPDGLWISDNDGNSDVASIMFNNAFGSTITNFSIDVTSWINNAVFHAYDLNGIELISTTITSIAGGYSDPGSYQTISFSSNNGVSGFRIDSVNGGIEGNTSIDNVVVNADRNQVPEPASLALVGLGLAGLLGARRKRSR